MKRPFASLVIGSLVIVFCLTTLDTTEAQKSRKNRFRSRGSQKQSQTGNSQTDKSKTSMGMSRMSTNSTPSIEQPGRFKSSSDRNTRATNAFNKNSRMRSQGNSIQVIEEAKKPARPNAMGRIVQQVDIGGKTMIRRKYSDQAINKIVDNGLLTREQANRANAIGQSKVDRLLETAGATAIIGVTDKVAGEAIENELKSKSSDSIARNKALTDAIGKQYNLPNLKGADAVDMLDGISQMNQANMDPGNAQNWRNFNQFKLGKMSGREVLADRDRASGTPADNPTPSGKGNASGADTGDVVIGGFQPVGGSPFAGSEGSGEGGNFGGSGGDADEGNADDGGSDAGTGAGSGLGTGKTGGSGPPASSGAGASPNDADPSGSSTVQPDGDPQAEDNQEQSGDTPTAVVEHNSDGSITVDYYEPNIDSWENEKTGSETYQPDGDGNYTGENGGKLKGTPPEGNYEYDNDPNTNSFEYKPEEKEERNDDSDDSADDGSTASQGDGSDPDGGDQGYTPNHDDGQPAATPENMAWAQARQTWVNGGLVNPGQGPAGERPRVDDVQQSPSANPRQGWATNPGPGAGSAQPSIQDWTRKFGGIGVADPPKPSVGSPQGASTGPAHGPQTTAASPTSGGPGPNSGR